jgi:hypothetical protein
MHPNQMSPNRPVVFATVCALGFACGCQHSPAPKQRRDDAQRGRTEAGEKRTVKQGGRMAKGMFTQGVAILLEQSVSLDEIAECLKPYDIVKRIDSSENWAFGGPSLTVGYRPDVNGYVAVDVVDRKWPDHMGDSKDEPMLFGAWGMGNFGPHAYPKGLQRACEQSWGWDGASEAVAKHAAFVRVRMSYVFGAKDDAPIVPEDYDPEAELQFLNKMTQTLLTLQGAICYFNPNGEVLRQMKTFDEDITYHKQQGIPPLGLWSNVRLFKVGDGWSMMDSVGNMQLEIPDMEVAFQPDVFSPGDVDYFIRNASLYILRNGQVIKDGDTMDGPGDIRWRAQSHENGMSDPPRPTLRWVPTGVDNIPDKFFEALE